MNDKNIEFNKWPTGEEYLMVKTRNLDQIISYVNTHRVKYLAINKHFGFNGRDLDFLSRVPSVTHLSVETEIPDVRGIYSLKVCDTLWLANALKHDIDFSLMPSLRDVGFYWNKKIQNLDKCTFLKDLNIIQYSFEDEALAALTQLRTLIINQPKGLNDLSFLKGYKKLSELHLYHCRTLSDISDLKKLRDKLKLLEFNKCKAVDDWFVLSQLSLLTKLILSDSAPIPHLKWVKSLLKLKMLSFVDTDIIDGNLDPVAGLEYVGFTNKKKYSHTFEELNPDWDK